MLTETWIQAGRLCRVDGIEVRRRRAWRSSSRWRCGEKRADDATGQAQRRRGGARGLCDGARAEMEGGGGRPEECAGEQWRMEEEGNEFIPLAKGTGSKIQPVPM